jgi:hypothetical protein
MNCTTPGFSRMGIGGGWDPILAYVVTRLQTKNPQNGESSLQLSTRSLVFLAALLSAAVASLMKINSTTTSIVILPEGCGDTVVRRTRPSPLYYPTHSRRSVDVVYVRILTPPVRLPRSHPPSHHQTLSPSRRERALLRSCL